MAAPHRWRFFIPFILQILSKKLFGQDEQNHGERQLRSYP